MISAEFGSAEDRNESIREEYSIRNIAVHSQIHSNTAAIEKGYVRLFFVFLIWVDFCFFPFFFSSAETTGSSS